MKQQLVDFLYQVHEPAEPYPIESCAEMLHGFRILDANDLDEVMKHATLIDRKFALVRALSTKDDVMLLVWAKILDEMGCAALGNSARQTYNEALDSPDEMRRFGTMDGLSRGPSTLTLATSLSTQYEDAIVPVNESPIQRRKQLNKMAKEWRVGDIPSHTGTYLDRDDEWDVRSAIMQLFKPGASYPRPPPTKRPNRAPRPPLPRPSDGTVLPRIPQSQQVSVLVSASEGGLVEVSARPKFHSEKGASRPLLLAVTGARGVGKSTMVAHIVGDDVFLQKLCGVGTVIWLNAAGIYDEDSFFEQIATKIDFQHPRDSRLKMRDILPSVLANLRQAVLLVIDDATPQILDWFSLVGGKSVRCIFVFRGDRIDDTTLSEQLGPQLSRESIVIENIGRIALDDMVWLLRTHWKSDLALPPGLNRESLDVLAEGCHGLPLLATLVQSLLETSISPLQTSEVAASLAEGGDAASTVRRLVELALNREKQEFRDRLFWLLAFGPGNPISVEDLSIVWNTPRPRAKLYCVDLVDKGLVAATSSRATLANRLHDACNYAISQGVFDAAEAVLRSTGESVAGFVSRQLSSPEYKHPRLAQARPGENFLHLAARVGHTRLLGEIVDLIGSRRDASALEQLCREQDRFQNYTPLHMLFDYASQESWQVLSLLAERLADTNLATEVRDKRGRSLTEMAIVELHMRRVGSGQTLLMVAARQFCYKFVKQLLETAATFEEGVLKNNYLDAKDDYGRTVLHQQSTEEGGSTDMVTLILENGANIEAVDNKRRTALHYVARFGCIDVCVVLIDRKCLLAPVDDCGKTPLALARIARHYGIIRLLEGYQLDLDHERKHGPRRLPTPEPRAHSAGVGDTDVFMHDVGAQTMPTTQLPTLADEIFKDPEEESYIEEYSDEEAGGESDGEDRVSLARPAIPVPSQKEASSRRSSLPQINVKQSKVSDYPPISTTKRQSRADQNRSSLEKSRSNLEQSRSSLEKSRSNLEHSRSSLEQSRRSLEHPRSSTLELASVAASPRGTSPTAESKLEVPPFVEGTPHGSDRSPKQQRRALPPVESVGSDVESLEATRHHRRRVDKAGRDSLLSEPGVLGPDRRQRRMSDSSSKESITMRRKKAQERKARTQESIRLHKASKIKICARRGEIPDNVVYLERREEEEKMREALQEMCAKRVASIIVVTGDRGCGCSTLVGEVLQQDDFIRDVCLVDMVLWVRLMRAADPTAPFVFNEEFFFRQLARLLQVREPSATALRTSEQKSSLLERKLREYLADRLRPLVLVVEGAAQRDHAALAESVLKLRSPLLKCIFVSRPAVLNLVTRNNQHTDDFALLSSFGEHVGYVHGVIRVRNLSKGKLGPVFQGFWSRPMTVSNPLDAIFQKNNNLATMLELPTIEELAEIYVGRPSLVANILYIALKSSYFEQDLQESFYGYVELLRQRQQIRSTQDPTMPPRLTQTESSIIQVLKFILDKEPKGFKRRYYSFLLFDDADIANQSTGLPPISENTSTRNGPITEEVAVAMVWNPYRNRYDNDLLLKALRRLGLTRHVGKYNYETAVIVMPNSLMAQLYSPDLTMPMKAHKLLTSIVDFRNWVLATSLPIPDPPPPETQGAMSQRTTGRSELEAIELNHRYGASSTLTDAGNLLPRSLKMAKGKKRVVVGNLRPKRLTATGRLTNRSQAEESSVSTSMTSRKATSSKALSKKPVPHLMLEGGKERYTNPVVAVLYYFDKVTHGH